MIKKLISHQPTGLLPLFFVELWERFGFYVVQAVLVLYLTKVFQLTDTEAYSIFGISSAFMYATPFIGGLLADKVLGYRCSIMLGAILLACGYWVLIYPGLSFFYFGLSLIVIGNGFFKSCISTLVGMLYEENDPRRDSGFTIFYMGINIGSFTGPIMAGYVSTWLGWPFVFGFTGLGLVIAFVIAILAFRLLGDKGLPPQKQPFYLLGIRIPASAITIILSLLAVFIFSWLIKHHHLANILFALVCIACVIGILLLALQCQNQERKNMLVLIILMLFSILFWAIYTQIFSSLNLFTDRIINRRLFGMVVPTAVFQAVNPFFIIVLTPFLVKFWPFVDRKNLWLASGAAKFSLALIVLSLCYFILVIGIYYHAENGQVNMWWLNMGYLFLTLGELCLSPIGLSIVSEFAPRKYKGMMMGAWMLSLSAGYSVGEYLSQFSHIPHFLLKASLIEIEPYYSHAFLAYAMLALVSGLLLWTLTPLLNKMLPNHG